MADSLSHFPSRLRTLLVLHAFPIPSVMYDGTSKTDGDEMMKGKGPRRLREQRSGSVGLLSSLSLSLPPLPTAEGLRFGRNGKVREPTTVRRSEPNQTVANRGP